MREARQYLLDLQKLAECETEENRGELLDRVTDLFFVTSEQQTRAERDVFGDVMERIAYELEVEARAQLSQRLARKENAPYNLMIRMAHDEIEVARPVLEHSPCLSEADLIGIANSTGQDHLHAISNRSRLSTAVTDVIVNRGNESVLAKVAGNEGASFSKASLKSLSELANSNTEVFSALEVRRDVPPDMLQEIKRAVAARLQRELVSLYPGIKAEDIDRMVSAKASDMDLKSFEESNRRFTELNGQGGITEHMVMTFARHRRLPETVHSLALLNDLELSRVSHCLLNADLSALAILCKANRFNAKTFAALIQLRTASKPLGARAIAEAMRYYNALNPENAQEAIAALRSRSIREKEKTPEAGQSKRLSSPDPR